LARSLELARKVPISPHVFMILDCHSVFIISLR
jgi:hypothetical protein